MQELAMKEMKITALGIKGACVELSAISNGLRESSFEKDYAETIDVIVSELTTLSDRLEKFTQE